MGCGMSTEDKEGKARNEEIENQLKRDKMLQRNEIKMLLLGQYTWDTRRALTHQSTNKKTCRGWRVWQIHHSQADEAHPRGRILPR